MMAVSRRDFLRCITDPLIIHRTCDNQEVNQQVTAGISGGGGEQCLCERVIAKEIKQTALNEECKVPEQDHGKDVSQFVDQ